MPDLTSDPDVPVLLGHAICQSSDVPIMISPEDEEMWMWCLIGFENQKMIRHTNLLLERRDYLEQESAKET
jgi:hypothetical protein